MKKQIPLPPIILSVFVCSLLYWSYLAFHTRMDIVWDSIGYEQLGRLLQHQGFIEYFKTGPNREPVYPLLICLSMHLGAMTSIAYTQIMAILGVAILSITQVLTYLILRKLNIRIWISVLILSYIGLSPALNNTAFSLYSEIATYPLILGIILISCRIQEAIEKNKIEDNCSYSILLGILLTMTTLTKAVFELICPFYLLIFGVLLFFGSAKKKLWSPLLCLLIAGSLFYVPIQGYKSLNQKYNGSYVITNRGSWALYGNTARRMEPMTIKRFLVALAYAPGEGVCDSLFGVKDCSFWSYTESDRYGMEKQQELNNQHLSPSQSNTTLLQLSKEKILTNPFQYALFMGIEGTKMLFWESTQIGFVEYPAWMTKIYKIKILNNGLRLLMALLTVWALFYILIQRKKIPFQSPIHTIGALIFLYIFFYSFFFILTRYALPIAPLYLICIGYSLDILL